MTTIGFGDRQVRNGQAAVASVRLGWQVVPWMMEAGRKVPQIKGWHAGAAFKTEDDIRSWWGVNFNHCPGIVAGSASGLWVLDVDPRNGGDVSLRNIVAQYGELPPDTFMVTTPGGGWHYYFLWTSDTEGLRKHAMQAWPGLDVIADGGWVAAPGAWSAAGRYELVAGGNQLRAAPGWLVHAAMSGNPSSVQDMDDHSAKDGAGGWDNWLNGEIERIGATQPGLQRTALLSFTAALRRRGYSREVADQAAVMTLGRLAQDPMKGPWLDSDVLEMVAGAWAKYEPVDMTWAQQAVGDDLVAQVLTPPDMLPPPAVPEPALMPPPAEQAAPGVDPHSAGVPLPASPPPPVNPFPAPVAGDPPDSIGPDHENAEDLIQFADGRLLWNSGMGWMIWNGTRWVVDDLLTRHRVIVELGHAIIQQAAAAGPDAYTAFMRRAQRLGTVQGRDACLNYARDGFAVRAEQFDADPWMLNTPGGIVDLRTGEVRPARPEDLVTQMTVAPFVPGAVDDVWQRVLDERVPDPADQRWLQKWMGYCLTGLDTEKAILAMHGPANTGKSTVTEPFARALGSYAIGWTAETIVANSKVNVQEALFRARGARLVTVNEMKVGTRLDEGVIKAATGGDKIIARALYQGSIEYRGQFKLWVHTNHVPDTRDDALLARMLFFGMEQQLDRDARDTGVKVWLEESEGAMSAVLWWAWQGLQEMMFGGLGRPAGSDHAVEEHALRSDPVRRFIHEILRETGGDEVAIWEDVALAYGAWCITEQVKPMGPTRLAHAFAERGLHKAKYRLTDGRRVQGIKGWTTVLTTESSQDV
jgi:P4 family phage/plasmid primase-like protien